MSTAEHLQELELLGEPGQWAVEHILRLTLENVQLKGQLEQAQAQIKKQDQQLEELQRQAHRQAAPFRRPESERNPHPAPPGRKAGHPGSYRPKPGHVDEQIRMNLDCCPLCQGPVSQKQSLTQYIEEIPEVRPRVTQLITEAGWCEHCQCEVCSTHPLQVSRARGAAGVQLGPRALALACDLNKAKGLSMRKTLAVLNDHFGLKLTPGGLALLVRRVGGKMQSEYEQMAVQLRQSPVVHAG
jgi:transposase